MPDLAQSSLLYASPSRSVSYEERPLRNLFFLGRISSLFM